MKRNDTGACSLSMVIICKNLLIRVDTGSFLRLDDQILFGSVR